MTVDFAGDVSERVFVTLLGSFLCDAINFVAQRAGLDPPDYIIVQRSFRPYGRSDVQDIHRFFKASNLAVRAANASSGFSGLSCLFSKDFFVCSISLASAAVGPGVFSDGDLPSYATRATSAVKQFVRISGQLTCVASSSVFPAFASPSGNSDAEVTSSSSSGFSRSEVQLIP